MIRVNTAILTFNRPTPPATLKVGFERCTVQPYVPSPLRCFKCQQFGHHQDNCSKTKVCTKCAQPDHQDTACTSAMKCVNCNGESNVFAQSERFPSLKLGKLLKGLTNNHHLPVLSRSRLCRLVARLMQ